MPRDLIVHLTLGTHFSEIETKYQNILQSSIIIYKTLKPSFAKCQPFRTMCVLKAITVTTTGPVASGLWNLSGTSKYAH